MVTPLKQAQLDEGDPSLRQGLIIHRNFHLAFRTRIIVHPNRRRWPRNGPDLPPAGTKKAEGAAVQAIFQTPRPPFLQPVCSRVAPFYPVRRGIAHILRKIAPNTRRAAGAALETLRREETLIAGSGMSYHNLAAMFSGRGAEAVASFDAWLQEAVKDPKTRDAKLITWRSAPGGRESHPREEHLIPLMVAAGAADGDPGVHSFGESIAGKAISGFQFG